MDLNETQKQRVQDLMERGWSEGLATMAVAAESAGMKDATNVGAGLVKALSSGGSQTKASIEAQRKKLNDELAAVAGKADHHSLQTSIGLRRRLAELNRA